PDAREQLDSVAVVTGCFQSFDALTEHLGSVRRAAEKHSAPTTFRVLEHNVTTEKEFEVVVGELGYDVFVTLECFDQELRNISLKFLIEAHQLCKKYFDPALLASDSGGTGHGYARGLF